MQKPNVWKIACALAALWLAAAIAAPAQKFSTLFSFDDSDGADPRAPLLQAADGALYGTTYDGGISGAGTVFKITSSGSLTTLYSFCSQSGCADGELPSTGLVQAEDGTFYGTTLGGVNGFGTVFRITPSGVLTTLYSFCSQSGCTDGKNPFASLIEAADGNFYGATIGGGANDKGTVFRITPTGTLTTLYSFCSQSGCADGASPQAGLLQGTDGNFYGTTLVGGDDVACDGGCGTVYKITPAGALMTLHSFDSTDGFLPTCTLIQATDGNFYGTTQYGGVIGYGTIFSMTPNGSLTTLHSFSLSDGAYPMAGLVQASDGNLWGTADEGGDDNGCLLGCGNVFKSSPGGIFTTVHSFYAGTGGYYPTAGLIQDTNGILYGLTTEGGTDTACADGCGTVFSLSAGLEPFVETQPTFGKVGKVITILGTSLTGTTSVTFNGVAASFNVELPSGIKATVPAGATTGPVQVVTPSGTLTSNVNFQVLP